MRGFLLPKTRFFCIIKSMKVITFYKRSYKGNTNPIKLLNSAYIKIFFILILGLACTYFAMNSYQGNLYILPYYLFITIIFILLFFVAIIDPFLALRNIKNSASKWDIFHVVCFLICEVVIIAVIGLLRAFACWKANPACSSLELITYFYKIPQNMMLLHNI